MGTYLDRKPTTKLSVLRQIEKVVHSQKDTQKIEHQNIIRIIFVVIVMEQRSEGTIILTLTFMLILTFIIVLTLVPSLRFSIKLIFIFMVVLTHLHNYILS